MDFHCSSPVKRWRRSNLPPYPPSPQCQRNHRRRRRRHCRHLRLRNSRNTLRRHHRRLHPVRRYRDSRALRRLEPRKSQIHPFRRVHSTLTYRILHFRARSLPSPKPTSLRSLAGASVFRTRSRRSHQRHYLESRHQGRHCRLDCRFQNLPDRNWCRWRPARSLRWRH